MGGKDYKAAVEIFKRVNEGIPHFTDVFDEEFFYIFAFFFLVCTIIAAIILSRYIKIKEHDL